jgi:hypothetical protein
MTPKDELAFVGGAFAGRHDHTIKSNVANRLQNIGALGT